MKHKCIKFLIATVVLINLLFSETYIAEMTTNELKIEEISKNQQIQLEIAHYLEDKAREPNKDIQEYETQLSELEQNQINRATAMWNLEEIADLQFEKIEISFEINDILEQTRSEILLEVYEWTSIYYYASSERIELDMMGYGVYHTMSFAIEGEQYTLVKDSFDESFMTGIKSVDYVADEKENTVKSDSLVMSVEENSEIRGVLETYENENITYDVNAAINYANQYCGASISNSSYSNINGVTALDDNNPNGYEPRFRRVDVTYFPGRDCANFVSQCMWAGNLWQDNIWNVDPDNDSDFNPTVTWINARALKNHFTSERKYKYEPIIYNDNYTNMFPGNPVCWINRSGSPSGHQMICTGYNSNGVPVLNGHNDDMFRVPYTVAESVAASLDTEAHNNDGLYTILVVTDDFHYHETFSYGSYTTSYHYGTCKHCRNQYSEEHTYKYEWNSINHWFGCESCNYKDFYSVHAKSYQSNTVQHWMGCTSCGYKEEVSSHSWCAISDQVEMCLVCNRRRSV